MATLTQCLTAALLHAPPAHAGAGAGSGAWGGEAALAAARAVLSVLVGAGRERVLAQGAGQGRRSALATLVPVVLLARAHAARAPARYSGQSGGQTGLSFSGSGRLGEQPGGLPGRAADAQPGGGQGMPVATEYSGGRAAGRAVLQVAAGQQPASVPQGRPGGVLALPVDGPYAPAVRGAEEKQRVLHTLFYKQHAPYARVAGTARVRRSGAAGTEGGEAQVASARYVLADSSPRPAAAPVPGMGLPHPALVRGGQGRSGQLVGHAGQRGLAVLAGGYAYGHVPHIGAGWVRRLRSAAYARTDHVQAGLMASVLRAADVGRAAPGVPTQHLYATSRAVGVASQLALQRAAPAPTVQAQITINATGSSPRAIGDELEHRMDTLRMQARQANMGQF